jgi:hypothetical protein
MAWTQADVDTLKAAIASGVKRVRYTDREVEYQSTEDMRAALSAAQQEVNLASGTPSYRVIGTRKGFYS